MCFCRKTASFAALIFALVAAGCSHPKQQVHQSNEFVDARVCASCHAKIAEQYKHTGMARAFSSPTDGNVINARPYLHRASGIWFQMISKGGHWIQRSWQIGYDGKEDNVQEWQVDYVMGSGNHVRTYLHRTARDSFVELPLAWYAEGGGTWAMNPGYDVSQPPLGRKIGYNCMFCHNAYPAIPAGHEQIGAEPAFSAPLPAGIDCQRCHGPGADHVKAAQMANPRVEDLKKTIVNPAKLAAARSMDVCMQCHLETTSSPLPNSIRRFDRGPFSYRPGEPLSAFRLIFDHPSGAGKDDKFEIVSSAYRLRKSRCFLASNDKLTCTTCHNPHDIPHGPDAAARYNGVCRQCHAVIAAKSHPNGGNCVGCHMPKRRTEDVVHAVMTDHFIQRRPARNLLAEFPERHFEYRGEVVPYGDADPQYTAVAQIITKTNLNAGIPRLEAAIAQNKPSEPEFDLELGEAYANTNQFDKAIAAFQRALARAPGSAFFMHRLASAYRGNGQPQLAADTLLRATQLDSSSADAWYDLGSILSDLGRKSDSISALRKATELDPEFAEAQNSLGAVLAETGQSELAEASFRAALRIQPTLTVAHANLANLLASKNELAEAAWHYGRAGSKALDQFNYGVTLARMKLLTEAQAHIEAALKADPNFAEAHDVLGGLLEQRGRLDAALAEYREAVRIRPNFGKAHLDLGSILLARHNLAAAAEEFRQAAADPNPAIRQQAHEALRSIGH